MVKQGDLVIASGKLYETSKGVSYGTIAGSKVEYSKDSGYEVFETSVSITAGGFAILFNSEGNVVGVSKASTDTSSKFIGISDLKAQIETMINEHGIMYCGITGQNVTEEYLAHLREMRISYIIVSDATNLREGLEAVGREFGIRRISVQGGGILNGALLAEGLIDELSLVCLLYTSPSPRDRG